MADEKEINQMAHEFLFDCYLNHLKDAVEFLKNEQKNEELIEAGKRTSKTIIGYYETAILAIQTKIKRIENLR